MQCPEISSPPGADPISATRSCAGWSHHACKQCNPRQPKNLELPASVNHSQMPQGVYPLKNQCKPHRVLILSAVSIKALLMPTRNWLLPLQPNPVPKLASAQRHPGDAGEEPRCSSAVLALPTPTAMPDGSLDMFPIKCMRVTLPHFLPTVLF